MPTDDASGLKSETTGSMASKTPVTKSKLNPNAPFFFPAAFMQIEDFSTEWWNLVHSSPAFRDYWIRERMQYVDGEELSAEDVDHLEAMVDFIDQEEPEVIVGDVPEDFLEDFNGGGFRSDFITPSNSAVDRGNLREGELVRSVKQLNLQTLIPKSHQREHNVYRDKIPLSPSKISSFPRSSAMHRIQQPR